MDPKSPWSPLDVSMDPGRNTWRVPLAGRQIAPKMDRSGALRQFQFCKNSFCNIQPS